MLRIKIICFTLTKHKKTLCYNEENPDIKNKSILYLGYIDDIFMIWTWAKQELLIFLEKLNSKHKTLEFEHNISHGNVSFFDALIKNR